MMDQLSFLLLPEWINKIAPIVCADAASESIALLGALQRGITAFLVTYRDICSSLIGVIGGGLYKTVTEEAMGLLDSFEPGGSSTFNAVHFSQLVKTSSPRRFDYGRYGNERTYGSSLPPPYRLTALNNSQLDVMMFYGTKDGFVDLQDLAYLLKEISKNPNVEAIPVAGFGHLDYMWAKEAKQSIYCAVVKRMFAMYRRAIDPSAEEPRWFEEC